MQTQVLLKQVSKKRLWTAWIMTGFAVLFLLFDSISKVMNLEHAVNGTVELGYPANLVQIIGFLLLICTIIYLIPKTSVFGAILLTGYFGGAVATHVRIENPLFSHILFPVYLGILIWGGLYLRNSILSTLLPFKKIKKEYKYEFIKTDR